MRVNKKWLLAEPFFISEDRDIRCLKAFGAAVNVEFNFLTFFEGTKTAALNRCVMNKDIFTFRLGKESVSL